MQTVLTSELAYLTAKQVYGEHTDRETELQLKAGRRIFSELLESQGDTLDLKTKHMLGITDGVSVEALNYASKDKIFGLPQLHAGYFLQEKGGNPRSVFN